MFTGGAAALVLERARKGIHEHARVECEEKRAGCCVVDTFLHQNVSTTQPHVVWALFGRVVYLWLSAGCAPVVHGSALITPQEVCQRTVKG